MLWYSNKYHPIIWLVLSHDWFITVNKRFVYTEGIKLSLYTSINFLLLTITAWFCHMIGLFKAWKHLCFLPNTRVVGWGPSEICKPRPDSIIIGWKPRVPSWRNNHQYFRGSKTAKQGMQVVCSLLANQETTLLHPFNGNSLIRVLTRMIGGSHFMRSDIHPPLRLPRVARVYPSRTKRSPTDSFYTPQLQQIA